jgi:hypothetical protein
MGESNWSKRSTREAEDVRAYIEAEIRKLLAIREFLDALPGYLLSDQANPASEGLRVSSAFASIPGFEIPCFECEVSKRCATEDPDRKTPA